MDHYGFKYVKLDGKMPPHKRDEVIRSFQTDGSIKIFLASLKCCSLGLNLTAANQCFIMDPWWNPVGFDYYLFKGYIYYKQKKNTCVNLTFFFFCLLLHNVSLKYL